MAITLEDWDANKRGEHVWPIEDEYYDDSSYYDLDWELPDWFGDH